MATTIAAFVFLDVPPSFGLAFLISWGVWFGVMLAAYASASRTLMHLVLWSIPVVVIVPIALGIVLAD